MKEQSAALVEATVRRTIGKAYLGLGEYDQAKSHLEAAYTALDGLLGPEDARTLECTTNLADMYCGLGEYGKAEPMYYLRNLAWFAWPALPLLLFSSDTPPESLAEHARTPSAAHAYLAMPLDTGALLAGLALMWALRFIRHEH